jgi:hypothetical protein
MCLRVSVVFQGFEVCSILIVYSATHGAQARIRPLLYVVTPIFGKTALYREILELYPI